MMYFSLTFFVFSEQHQQNLRCWMSWWVVDYVNSFQQFLATAVTKQAACETLLDLQNIFVVSPLVDQGKLCCVCHIHFDDKLFLLCAKFFFFLWKPKINQTDIHLFSVGKKIQYFKIDLTLKCSLITFLAWNVHFIVRIFVQLMCMILSGLTT